MNIEDLDWGTATPEMYDEKNQVAWHVINANLIGDENVSRICKFTCARVVYFNRHLPKSCTQHIRFDLRGQMISNKKLTHIRERIVEGSTKQGIQVVVDFLTS